MKYTIIIKESPTSGMYIGQCAQVPGALTQGATISEVMENIKEAIELVLDAEKELTLSAADNENCIKREIQYVFA